MRHWHAIILAAGRGPDDPMAKAFGVAHKCTIPVAGKSMLQWVVDALRNAQMPTPFSVAIDDPSAARMAVDNPDHILIVPAQSSAPASALAAVEAVGTFPVLLTTGDHPLLTAHMLQFIMAEADTFPADILIGLATSDVINAAYPETKRTYFNLGGTRVSGCNLFVVNTQAGCRLLHEWQYLERNRKKPWKLVAAFGMKPLFLFAIGRLTPTRAFGLLSKKLGIAVTPVFLPFAEAAIDVDKPSDHALAEAILKKRLAPA